MNVIDKGRGPPRLDPYAHGWSDPPDLGMTNNGPPDRDSQNQLNQWNLIQNESYSIDPNDPIDSIAVNWYELGVNE